MDDREITPMQQDERGQSPITQEEWPASRKDSFFGRVWKYRFHYVIVLPALLLLILFKAVPFMMTVVTSFQDFKVLRGIAHSHWVGWSNYRQMFTAPEFHQVLANTLIMKLIYTGFCGIAALVLALSLSMVAGGKLRSALATLFLIPYFIPAVIFANMVVIVVSSRTSPIGIHSVPLAHSNLFRGLYVCIECMKTIGIPVLIAIGAIGAKHAAGASDPRRHHVSFFRRNVVPAMLAVSAFMLMQLSTLLSNQFELMYQLINPIVYQTGDTLENMQFRSAFMLMDIKASNPVAVFQFIVQFGCTLLAYYILRACFARHLFTSHNGSAAAIQASGSGKSAVGTVVSLLYALAVVAMLYLLFVYPFTIRHEGPGLSSLVSGSRFVLYLVVYLAASAVFMLMTLTLSFPLTVKDLPGRSLYKWFLLAVMSVGSISFMAYYELHQFRLTNTVFALFVSGFFSILPVFILKSIYNARYAALRPRYERRGETYMFFRVYVPAVWKPLLALGAMQFTMLWNSMYLPLIYMSKPDLMPPISSFLMAAQQTAGDGKALAYGPAAMLQFGALIALPSLLVLLFMRRWLTPEVLTGQVRNL
ncbi:hypothetical protein GZH47_28210 [Paenibacillus rhizovicinus]|uniref:ABC transporter permease subunit n=1 Tax=Paenibacillus rhizovicinus TaxID=2704463 RepID=A0A6C0P7E0_9BACL|nr:hypothetical protein [Paenibacillus rhizovicinus]QHW34295.1 hypothetical protein GZH47_28210 [Paenibacillus rhizovicinus]